MSNADSDDIARIRRYLLGQLPETEADDLEERYFAESDFFELVDAVADTLGADYASGRLKDLDRARVAELARTSAWRTRLKFSDAMVRVSGATDGFLLDVKTTARGVAAAMSEAHQVMVTPVKPWADVGRMASGILHRFSSLMPPPSIAFGAVQGPDKLLGDAPAIHAIALVPHRAAVVAGVADHTVRLYDLATKREMLTLAGHTGPVYSVAVTPDGKFIVSASADATLRVWDVTTGLTVRELKGHLEAIHAVAITSDGQRLFSSGDDGTLRIWELETGQSLRVLHGQSRLVHALALFADGGTVLSAAGRSVANSKYGFVIRDLDHGRVTRTVEAHDDWVTALALTDDGSVVSASSDGTLRVWNLRSDPPELESAFTGHVHAVRAVATTPDGTRLVSGSDDRTVRVWNRASGKEERVFVGHQSWVTSVVVTPDGQYAISGSDDGTLCAWDLHEATT